MNNVIHLFLRASNIVSSQNYIYILLMSFIFRCIIRNVSKHMAAFISLLSAIKFSIRLFNIFSRLFILYRPTRLKSNLLQLKNMFSISERALSTVARSPGRKRRYTSISDSLTPLAGSFSSVAVTQLYLPWSTCLKASLI